jgi:hypothetical protein
MCTLNGTANVIINLQKIPYSVMIIPQALDVLINIIIYICLPEHIMYSGLKMKNVNIYLQNWKPVDYKKENGSK